ncbi:MAG: hypothetical protein MJH10_08165 [Epibacterium sp.]|nr:hypothetical protein [Epibacterium sp.]NQX73512.1 hypothetical protein [Epibacterium sp.]
MTVSIHITYTPIRDRFDEVLNRVGRYIDADLSNPDRIETRLFTNREDCLIRAYSTWTHLDAFYTFMNAAIDDGAFGNQGDILQHEIEVQIFNPEPIG